MNNRTDKPNIPIQTILNKFSSECDKALEKWTTPSDAWNDHMNKQLAKWQKEFRGELNE